MPENILLAAHSYDADFRPLNSYIYQEIRYLHILGSYGQWGRQSGDVSESS